MARRDFNRFAGVCEFHPLIDNRKAGVGDVFGDLSRGTIEVDVIYMTRIDGRRYVRISAGRGHGVKAAHKIGRIFQVFEDFLADDEVHRRWALSEDVLDPCLVSLGESEYTDHP